MASTLIYFTVKTGKVKIMKNIGKITGVLIVTLMLTSCVAYDNRGYNGYHNGNKIPPDKPKKSMEEALKIMLPDRLKREEDIKEKTGKINKSIWHQH